MKNRLANREPNTRSTYILVVVSPPACAPPPSLPCVRACMHVIMNATARESEFLAFLVHVPFYVFTGARAGTKIFRIAQHHAIGCHDS